MKGKNEEKWKIINMDYFVGVRKVNQQGEQRHRRMAGNEEKKSLGLLEEGNEAS